MNNIKEMLKDRKLETNGKVIKIVRHVLTKSPDAIKAHVVRSAANFAEWQRVQEVSGNGADLRLCDYFISCCYLPKDGNTYRALFVGVFHNESKNPAKFDIDWHLSPQLAEIYRGRPRRDRYFFEFRRDPRFADLERCVIVEWQGSPRAWVQNFDSTTPNRILQPIMDKPRWIFDEGYGA